MNYLKIAWIFKGNLRIYNSYMVFTLKRLTHNNNCDLIFSLLYFADIANLNIVNAIFKI